MRIYSPFVWLILLIAAASGLRGQEAPPKERQFTCGLNATYMYLNRAGRHVDYDELVQEFEAQNPRDSLLAIRNVLSKHGCPTVAIRTDSDYFLGENGPAIVYLELDGYSLHGESHFSYMVGASRKNGVEFLDPIFELNRPSAMSYDTFSRIFKGVALVAHE